MSLNLSSLVRRGLILSVMAAGLWAMPAAVSTQTCPGCDEVIRQCLADCSTLPQGPAKDRCEFFCNTMNCLIFCPAEEMRAVQP